MYAHYKLGRGESLNLDNLGAKKLISHVILKQHAFGIQGSIRERFLLDIVADFLEGKRKYTFNNNYDIGSEINIWAFGSGVIFGEFFGKITKLKSGDFSVIGKIVYQFSDIFEDPYDTFDWVDGSWDPYGTPYKITDTIIHQENAVIYATKAHERLTQRAKK